MKKFIQWLAKVFEANITIEKIVTKEVVKEVPIEKVVTKEVIKEVEKPIYVVSSTIPSDTKLIEGDVVIGGNLEVKGNLYVSGGVTCLNDIKVKRAATNNAKRKGGKK